MQLIRYRIMRNKKPENQFFKSAVVILNYTGVLLRCSLAQTLASMTNCPEVHSGAVVLDILRQVQH